MKLPNKPYLDTLLKLDIHKIVSTHGDWQQEIQHRSVLLDCHQGFLIFYLDGEPVKQWKLSSQPHDGRLRNGGSIPWQCDEIYFVVGSDRKRYRHLWLDPETLAIGTRMELGARYNWRRWRSRAKGKAWDADRAAIEEWVGTNPNRPLKPTRVRFISGRIAPEVQAIFFRRRHQPRRPTLAKIRPGKPAPAMGPGTPGTVANTKGSVSASTYPTVKS